MARAPLGGSGRAAMTELGWRSRSTLTSTFIIAAGTLAAAHYCSRLHNHCATSPNSGSEYRWGISATQDSRDSDFYSDCHSNMVAVGQMSVPSHASAHRVDSLQAMLDCSASLPSATAETGCLASHSAMLYCYASLPFSASAELGRLASSCSACSFWGFNTTCASARQHRRDRKRRDRGGARRARVVRAVQRRGGHRRGVAHGFAARESAAAPPRPPPPHFVQTKSYM